MQASLTNPASPDPSFTQPIRHSSWAPFLNPLQLGVFHASTETTCLGKKANTSSCFGHDSCSSSFSSCQPGEVGDMGGGTLI